MDLGAKHQSVDNMTSSTSSTSSIAEFYRDRSIFITGATGFMGKVLVEKMLRSCPGISRIYLLLRPKKGQDVRQRLSELLGSKLFVNLKKDQPEILKKVLAIKGDITEPLLGISESNLKLLADEVSVVFHSAATVRFDEPLKVAVEMNIVGTKRVMDLSRQMTKLVSLVHVSTAYCNCDREVITETVYPLLMKPQQLLNLATWVDNELVKSITPKLIGAHPNTYTYTKAMTEYMLLDEYADLPIGIVRPSIVVGAWKEPLRGWVDNLNGLVGMLVAIGKGLVKSNPFKRDCTADLIPVDIAINLMISVGWYTAAHGNSNLLAYNCTSGQLNPTTWGDIARFLYPHVIRNPVNGVMWCPSVNYDTTRFLVKFYVAVDHYMPAYLCDMMAWITGRKGSVVRIQDQIHRALKTLLYFKTHQWRFSNDNLRMLWERIQPEDQELFPFDVTDVSWPEYWSNGWLGIKTFLLQEQELNQATIRDKFNKSVVITHTFNMFKLLLVWRVLAASSKVFHRLFASSLPLLRRLLRTLLISS